MRSQGRFSPRFTRRACLRAVRFSLGVIRQPAGFDPVSREYDTAVVTDSPSIKKIFKDLKLSMDKYVLHSNFEDLDMGDEDIVLGYTWIESMGTININVQKKFLKI
jgi:hypothetical protein